MENSSVKVKTTRKPRNTKVSSSIAENSVVEGLSPVLGSVSASPVEKSTDTKPTARKRLPSNQTRKAKEEMDPGELVSVWHKMNKKYQSALDSLTNVANQLDELSKELENTFGIKVPNAKRLEKTSNQTEVQQASSSGSSEDSYNYESASSWTPPVQSSVSTGTIQNPNFVEQMRRDSFEGENASDQSFAASIAAQFNSIMGSLK